MVDVAAERETRDNQRDAGSDGYDGSQPCGRTGVDDERWRCPENSICEDYCSYHAQEAEADRWNRAGVKDVEVLGVAEACITLIV